MNYIDFLRNKMAVSHETGFEVSSNELTETLYPHVKDTVRWAVKGGCRAIFSSFGMQKTVTQLEILRVITNSMPQARSCRVRVTGKEIPRHGNILRSQHARGEILPDKYHGNELRES